MKTLKHITLLIGIILGIMIIFGQASWANGKEKKAAKAEKKTSMVLDQQELKAVEMKLIENYLEDIWINENLLETVTDEQALIYTVDGQCVYKGNKKDAEDLIKKSELLFTTGNDSYYVTIK